MAGITAKRGKDAVFHLRLTLQQAALGTLVRPRVPFHAVCARCTEEGAPPPPCPACGGRGLIRGHRDLEVQVPGGVDSGARLRLRGLGEPGLHGGPRGDLYLVCDVREHPLLVRRGADLFCEVVISPERARTGTVVDVPALDGGARLQVPPATPHGAVFPLPGRGARSLQAPARGALYVRVIVGAAERPAKGADLLARFPSSPPQSAPPGNGMLLGEALQVEATDAPPPRRLPSWALGGVALLSLLGVLLALWRAGA